AALVEEAEREARGALTETRRTMLGLMERTLHGRDVAEVLAAAEKWARRTGQVDVRLVVAGTPVTLDPAQAYEMVRVAQEALTNIVQHARATLVRLGIAYETSGVSLLVQDDGRGFDPQGLPDDAGSGLRRMSD